MDHLPSGKIDPRFNVLSISSVFVLRASVSPWLTSCHRQSGPGSSGPSIFPSLRRPWNIRDRSVTALVPVIASIWA
jgi:hypothetical protein